MSLKHSRHTKFQAQALVHCCSLLEKQHPAIPTNAPINSPPNVT